MVLVHQLAGVTKVLPKPVNSQDTYRLSQEQLKFYEDNGYLVLKQFIDFASLYTYKQRFVQICKGIVPSGNMMVIKEPKLIKQNLKPEDYINKIQEVVHDDVFVQYAEHPLLLSVISQMIGDEVTVVNSMFINKPPGASRHPAHQDLFYFPFRPAEKIIGSWTAVDDVTFENGCLFVVPGSHKTQTVYDHGGKKNTLKLYHGLDEEILAPPEKRVHLEMSPGDTVLLNPYLIHGSGANTSKAYRKAITFHFANSMCEYIDLTNTVQEPLAKQIEGELIARHYGTGLKFLDLFRMKCKQIKGVRSNL